MDLRKARHRYQDRFFDRELSWLHFNQRVCWNVRRTKTCPCSSAPTSPPDLRLEPVTSSSWSASPPEAPYRLGHRRAVCRRLSPRQQLRAISETAHRLQDEHAHYTIDTILPELEKERIVLLTWDKLTSSEQERLSRYYRQQVFPVLTPLAVDQAHPFPYISGGSINLAVIVENPASGKSHFARVKIRATCRAWCRWTT